MPDKRQYAPPERRYVNEEMEMREAQKKPTPAGVYVFCLTLYAALFAYPIAEGGLGNLAAFLLWLLAPFMLFVAVFALCTDDTPSRWKEMPRWANWLSRLVFWAGVSWVIYHGYFAIPAMLVVAAGITHCVVRRRKEAGIE